MGFIILTPAALVSLQRSANVLSSGGKLRVVLEAMLFVLNAASDFTFAFLWRATVRFSRTISFVKYITRKRKLRLSASVLLQCHGGFYTARL